MDTNTLGKAIRDRRKALHISQEALAQLAGCSQRFVHELEAGKMTVRLDALLSVLSALGLQITVESGRAGLAVRP